MFPLKVLRILKISTYFETWNGYPSVVNSVKIIVLLVRARDRGAILVLVPGL